MRVYVTVHFIVLKTILRLVGYIFYWKPAEEMVSLFGSEQR